MKNLARTLLTEAEQQRLKDCVAAVEKKTSGEIVPVIASMSSDYARSACLATLFGALLLSIPAALILGMTTMWSFLVVFLGGYLAASLLVRLRPGLMTLFLSHREKREEVHKAAVINFHAHGLHHTRDLTGILIYVSVFERRVAVLADSGIDAKVDPGVWQEIVDMVTKGIKSGQAPDALCRAVSRCGELITTNFPVRPDDVNELPDLIVDGEAK